MKVKIRLKAADAVADAVCEAVVADAEHVKNAMTEQGLAAWQEQRSEAAHAVLARWVRNEEYIDVEFDLAALTSRVIEVAS